MSRSVERRHNSGAIYMSINTQSRSNTHEGRSAIKPASSLGKGPWKKVIDLILYVLFCAMVGTGMLLSYRLPNGDGTFFKLVVHFFLVLGGMNGERFTPGSVFCQLPS